MEEIQQNQVTEPSIKRIKNGWTAMSQAKRIALIAGISLALAGAGIYATNSSGSDYVVLYSGLDYKTAGEIKQALMENGVTNFKLGSDGTSILVKSNEVDSIRMDLAVSGVSPDSGTGYELLDTSQVGLTEQDRQVRYQRALEGELRRSIISLEGVDDARVHLNLKEDSVFSRDESNSTASVVLSVKRGVQISESQVNGIMALVSGAAKNLPTENIEIIDSNGNLLSSGQGFNGSGSSNDHLSQKAAYEKHLEDKIRSMAGKIFGFNDMIVAVNVDLNQASEEQRKEEYSDGSKVSEETHFTREEGVGTGPESGSPIDNNMQNPIVDTDEALANPDIFDYSNLTNYQPSVTETHTVKPPGEVEKVSVSFVYNGELTQPLIEELELLIASAAGIDPERGDSLRVAGIPFNENATDSDFENADASGTTKSFPWIYAVVGAGVLGAMGWLISKRKRQKALAVGDSQALETMGLPGYEGQPVDYNAEFSDFMQSGFMDPVDVEALRLKIIEFFKSELDFAMELLRVWMYDESVTNLAGVEVIGMDKAARLLVLLGRDITTEVMKQTTQDEIIQLTHLISSARSIPMEQTAVLVEEFYQMIEARSFIAQGGYDFAKDSMIAALGAERADQLLRKMKGAPRNKKPFEIIRHMDATQLYNALSEEHPQTIALVLCYLPDEKAAAIIGELPEHMQLDVVQRIGMMSNTTSQIVDEVEHVIEARLQSLMSADMAEVGGLNTVVGILNASERSTQKHIIELLANVNPQLAEDVRDSMFTFEDLVLLDNTAIQRIVREVEAATLALSLKGASEEILDLIKRNMSTRAAERLQEDIEYLGAVRLSEVEQAQSEIIVVVRRLEDAGEIIIGRGGSDDVVY